MCSTVRIVWNIHITSWQQHLLDSSTQWPKANGVRELKYSSLEYFPFGLSQLENLAKVETAVISAILLSKNLLACKEQYHGVLDYNFLPK